MKNNIKNLLRGGVMMLAAVFAFAFTQPQAQMGFAPIFDQQNPTQVIGWVDVSTLQEGIDYECNDNPTPCLYEEEDLQSQVVREGVFELL
ncbi:hypothetical protein [Belliella aquatica]|uniref:Uncharacterized protein n=1 Tax=Belliella aquatica TaxID=1323734 RepID=A0ABQ1N783_9BACT|nr:hypothetical protein [Belliella aquatica]MCH7407425.1 hypothetical protein [Belliella aquatica]GGC53048.1 hypothetical protein GCM10010993_34350 [Belliella aquatica]